MALNIPKSLYYSIIFLILAFAFRKIADLGQDYDLWMHIFFGKEIVSNLSVPKVDIYSFTATGAAIYNHEWLSQVIFYYAYSFGPLGLILLKAILFFGILFFIWKVIDLRVENLFYKVSLFFLCLLVLNPGIAFRIQLFSYLFLAFILYLQNIGIPEKSKFILYPLIFLIWANLHGAFVLGLCVLGLFELENLIKNKSLNGLIAVFLAGVITFINPNGITLWTYIIHEVTLSKSAEFITEWQSFSFQPRENAFFIMFMMSWILCIVFSKNVRTSSIVLLVVASYLGITSVRNSPILAILALPLFCDTLINFPAPKKRENNLSRVGSIVTILFSGMVFFLSFPRDLVIHDSRDPLPKEAVSFIKTNELKGNIFLPLHWGGYMLFETYPDLKVSIDGRWATTYPPDIMEMNHNFYYQAPAKDMTKIMKTYDANYLLVERDHHAVKYLEKEHYRIFSSDVSVLFQIKN